DESIVRKTIQRIAHGDYAHLPNIADIKALFNSPLHQKILRNAYSTLQLTRVSIDETTARVISVILLSRQCQCRHLKLYRCAFTDAGKKILFSALSMMADQPAPKRRRRSSSCSAEILSATPMHHVEARGLHADESMPMAAFGSKISAVGGHASGCAEEDAVMGLYSLEFFQIGLADSSCQALGQILCAQPLLRQLKLSSNLIGPSGIRKLVTALSSNCPRLTTLDLSDNRLQSAGAEYLAQYMLAYGRGIRSLDVSSNEITLAGAGSLAAILRPECKTSLTLLNLDMNQLGSHGCVALAGALATNQTLETLKCSRNNIFDQGCETLFASLGHNTTLRHLDISGNFITRVGAQAIGEYLQAPGGTADSHKGLVPGLRTLDVSGNSLQDEGMDNICSGLHTNNRLVHLVADNTEISDAGALAVGQLLEHKAGQPTSLITLSLRFGRHITDLGYRALITACKKNSHILRLKVDLQFEEWRPVWSSLERTFIYNNMRAIDRYRAPLLMATRGRMLLWDPPNPTGILKLPMDIRRLIIDKVDRYGVLSPQQRSRAVKIATSANRCNCKTKADVLAYILGDDYAFVQEIYNAIH
ncbi:hypothetical protein GGI15_003037, partial [Coemansia interrupta]